MPKGFYIRTKIHRKLISGGLKGRKLTKEHKEAIGASLLGKKHTEEHVINVVIGRLKYPGLNRHDRYLRSNYGITEIQYNELLKSQNEVCAICHKPETGKRNKRLCVDHNHSTGKIRGLLCNKCNVILGQYNDDKEVFLRIYSYLKDSEI